MYAQELYENLASRGKEAATFEKRILPWLKELAQSSKGDAVFLTRMLTKDCNLRGRFQKEVEHLHAKLVRDPEAVAHVKGLEALDNFSEKELAKYGNLYAPLPEHAPVKFKRITKNLAEKYRRAEDLQPLFKQLAKPTHR